MFDADDPPILLLLILGGVVWLAWQYWKVRESPEMRARRLEEEARQRRHIEEEREELLAKPVPPDIARAMKEYLRNKKYIGEEHSPLAYVGYRVGKTNGLAPWDRQRRLRVCFQMEIPNELAGKYRDWGPPVTYQRYAAMCRHLSMLADMRRHRRNYEYAVADWETDEQWLASHLTAIASRLRRWGF